MPTSLGRKDWEMADLFSKKRNVVWIAILYTFLWGCCFPLVKLCMDGFGIEDNMSKCLVAGIRFALAGLGLIIYEGAGRKRKLHVPKGALPYLLSYGLLGTALQYAFTYIGLSHVDSAKGAIFDQLCVFMIIILSGLFLKNDKLTAKKLLGCLIGFLGILAVSSEKMQLTFSFNGECMMTLAALCQTGAYFIAIACADKVLPARLVGYGQFFGGAILIIFSLIMGGRILRVTLLGVLSLVALAIFAAVAYVLSLIPLKHFPASEVSVFNLLITVFGVVMSGIVLKEKIFKINYLAALILIILGILLVNWRKQDALEHI